MATPAPGPAGPRRRLGAELRRLRAAARLHLDQVAREMQCSASKISRLETGKGIPKAPDVRELMRIYGVADTAKWAKLLQLVEEGRAEGWWEAYTEGVPPERFVMDAPSRYTALETAASTVRAFELGILHGLLQTSAYTRVVLQTVLPHHTSAEIDRLVELRARRQHALVDPYSPMQFTAVIDEAVLSRVVGNRRLMVDQLGSMIERSQLPNVAVQILPLDVGFRRAHNGSFIILEFPEDIGDDLVYIEGHAGETFLENPADVDLYREVLADVSERALDPAASRELIDRYRAHFHASEGSPQ